MIGPLNGALIKVEIKKLARTLAFFAVAIIYLQGVALGDAVAVDQVLAAWKARADATQSFQATFVTTRRIEPGGVVGKETREIDDEGKPFPREPVTVRLEERLLFDGDDWRYESQGSNWNNAVERLVDGHRINIRKGDKFQIFEGANGTDPEELHSMAYVSTSESRRRQLLPQIAALMATFRPFAEHYGHFNFQQWRVNRPGRQVKYREHDVIVLEFEHYQQAAVVKRVWAVPAMDFAIVKMEFAKRILIDVRWKQEETTFRPLSWKFVSLSPDLSRIDSVYETQIFEYEVNPNLSADAFEISYPAKTEILDHTLPLTEKQLPTIAVIKDDGSKRIVTWEERALNPTYAEILATNTGEAKGSAGSTKPNKLVRFGVIGAIVVLLLVASTVALRRK